ncbi:hypothetical protein LSTR_LSTR015117 [Laodelphax striatellus]|uniref:Uncharacterized protein n=1 Tax=Laodelphax striatellus TaxID=195883 RepID=A0A482WH12_LAOST|nr:hypothetical protein LSTR_LSTR015117 [Laodelphax striatellus]
MCAKVLRQDFVKQDTNTTAPNVWSLTYIRAACHYSTEISRSPSTGCLRGVAINVVLFSSIVCCTFPLTTRLCRRTNECDVVRGECTQTYVPYLFLVIPLGPVTLTGQDYVLVESGCVCKPKYASSSSPTQNDPAAIPHTNL